MFLQGGLGRLTPAAIQELYDPTLESVAHLDDLQRSWESLKNVVGVRMVLMVGKLR